MTILLMFLAMVIFYLERKERLKFWSIVFTVLLLINFMTMFIVRMNTSSKLNEMQAVEDTVWNLRQYDKGENMTISQDIIKWNVWLAEQKYYNQNILFDWYIPDIVEIRQPI